MWKLGLFLCSNKKIDNCYKVKCTDCDKHHVTHCVWDYDGTNTFFYHAEKCHSKNPKFVEWRHQKAVRDAQKKEEKAAEEQKLAQV